MDTKFGIAILILLMTSPVFAALGATASISPRYVDTSVVNQTFVYTIVPGGAEDLNRTIVFAPQGYDIVSLTDVTVGINNDSCLTTSCQSRFVNRTQIHVNFTSIVNNTYNSPIRVTFMANTSATNASGLFNALVSNSAESNAVTQNSTDSMNVTTFPVINIANVEMSKGAAVVNGTDYWEFRFTLGFNSVQQGLIQFRMTNWTDAGGNSLNLYSGSSYYASLRNETSFSGGILNVTNSYGPGMGINRTSASVFYLKMIIPSGTKTSNSWSAAYNFLFRASP